MTTSPTITVVVPVHNAERYLAEAIDSLLAQSHPATAIIIVDDGSTDGSLAIARDYAARHPQISVATQPNGGAASARNAGIAMATSDLIGFLDADDIAEPHYVATQLARLQADSSLAGVMGHCRVFVESGAPEPLWLAQEMNDGRERPRLMSMVVRRDVFDVVGVFDPTLTHGEDADWVLRAGETGHSIAIHTEVLVARRVHGASLTQDSEAVVRSQFEVLARRIRRRQEES